MSVHNETRRITAHDIARMHANGERIAMLTCYDATFAAGFCDQAWRWNLDYVVDVHGNTITKPTINVAMPSRLRLLASY